LSFQLAKPAIRHFIGSYLLVIMASIMLTGTPSDTRLICSQLILQHRSLGAFDIF